MVNQLDLAAFYPAHRDDGHGHPAYDPKLLLGVLLYGYCIGVRSSRQIERRCHQDLAFGVLAGNQTPDHVTIARFRVRHQQALTGFLVASLRLCAAAGQLARLRQAKARLEAEATRRWQRFAERVAASAAAATAKGKPPPTLKPRRRDEAPNPTATANVTDPDSRLLHARKGRVQGYNAQAVSTCEQVIVAAELTQQANDFQQLAPMLTAISATLAAAGVAERPDTLAADSGYWSIANLTQIPDAPQLLIHRPSTAATASPARTASQRRPRATGSARR